MKLTIQAQRQQLADERLQKAAGILADALGVQPPDLTPQVRQPAVARLMRDEALADFLTAVAEQPTAVPAEAEGYLSQADILAIPGLTKTSKDAIAAYIEAQDAGSD